jgi:hypothetical protein
MQKGQKHFFRESRERGPFICFIMDNENKSSFAGDHILINGAWCFAEKNGWDLRKQNRNRSMGILEGITE